MATRARRVGEPLPRLLVRFCSLLLIAHALNIGVGLLLVLFSLKSMDENVAELYLLVAALPYSLPSWAAEGSLRAAAFFAMSFDFIFAGTIRLFLVPNSLNPTDVTKQAS